MRRSLRRCRGGLGIVCCWLSVACGMGQAQTQAQVLQPVALKVAGERWAPFNNWAADPARPGFLIEIVQSILKRAGHTLVYTERPWARAVEETKSGRMDALVGADRHTGSGLVFPGEPIGFSVSRFYVRQDSSWRFTGIESLAQVKVGLLVGATYGQAFDNYVARNRRAVDPMGGEDYLRRSFIKLGMGRIDAFLEDGTVIAAFLKETDQQGQFKDAGALSQGEAIFIAFSPRFARGKDFATLITEGVRNMRKSGELKTILARYGVIDWK